MQSKTIKNIANIKSSWRSMQTALIASAENIRKQTGDKIKNLRDNMASFWQKIQNPSLLLQGNAGSPTKTSNSGRRYRPTGIKRSVSSTLGYAGSSNGISPKYKAGKNSTIREQLAEALQMLFDNKPHYAGWNFNWNKPIQDKFNKWNTNFNSYHIDDHVKAGKFYNNNFPVKRIAEIAKAYIFDAISRTSYEFYYDGKYGSPLDIWKHGSFNCYDGTQLVLALARAFGFTGSQGHTTWNGIGHMFANIPGLGVIDPTAIQQRGSFRASGVKYAGSPSPKDMQMGETHNYNGDVIINIHTDGENVTIDDKRINRESGKQILDILGINPSTGR